MKYPSLLYYEKQTIKPIDVSVFEDLQLAFFIDGETAKAVSVPCAGENITARHEIFRLLENPEFRTFFSELYETVCDICDLDKTLKQARCDFERNVIFASLMRLVIAFAEKASAISKNSRILTRFSDFFSGDIKKDMLTDVSEKALALIRSIDNFRYGRFTSHGLSLKMSRSDNSRPDQSYYDRISECAKKLGLDPLCVEKIKPHQLSSDIIKGYEKLYPDEFAEFDEFYKKYSGIYSGEITAYKTEIGFYLTVTHMLDMAREINIPLVYPDVTEDHIIKIRNAYDISLIAKDETNIVPNDIEFSDGEPFYYLTGANGGGKTTYLRTVGIAALLYIMGCPMPCDSAVMGNISGIFTHFPHDERFTGTGRFVEEQNRVKRILSEADGNSLVLLNETYSSTNEENAVACTKELADTLYSKKIFGLYITHQHAVQSKQIPYLNVLIDRDNENRRTFKVARMRDDGGSFALDILKKYSLTKEALEKRFEKMKSDCRI